MRRVDAHQHFWDPGRAEYPWMTAALTSIRRPFRPADLRPHLAAGGIEATILVQTRPSLEETREFLAIAERTSFVAGVVGWVDLTRPDVAAQIAGLRGAPGGAFLVGIRHQVHDEADPVWLMRDDVRRGIAAVGAAGLVYDLLVREREFPAARDVVTRFPEMRFVLDHLGKPPIASATMPAGWAAGIAQLAERDNVWCKISGMVTEADWVHWTCDDLRPYLAHVLHRFGHRRLLFGSDWPVCLLAASYERVDAATRELLCALVGAPADIDGILGPNAVAVYRLAARVTDALDID